MRPTTPNPVNEYGNVDIIHGVPPGHEHVPGLRLAPLCRALKIQHWPALVDWTGSRRRRKPVIDGVLVPAADAPALRAAVEARQARAKTPTQRTRDRERRQHRDVERFTAAILQRYPSCPPDEASQIAEQACEIGSGRVGRSRVVEDGVRAAVVAHVRHQHTDYDDLLSDHPNYEVRQGAREEVRRAVAPEINAILAAWERPASESAGP